MTVLLSTGTTGFLGGYLVWKSYQSLRLQAQQAQLTLAKTLAWQVDQSLSNTFQAIEVLSKRPEITLMVRSSVIREMTLVTNATELIDGLLLFTPQGHLFAQGQPSVNPQNLPPSSFFIENIKRAEELKSSVLVDVYKTKSDEVGVAVSAPVFRDGHLVGVLVGVTYLPNHSIKNLETAHFGKTGYAYMVNQQGFAIVHPDKTRLLGTVNGSPAVQKLKTQKEGVIQFKNRAGEEVLAAFATVESASWGVIVRQTAEECYEPAARMLKFMSLFLALTLIASLLLALTLSERVVRPILNLATQVGRYESGQLDSKKWESLKPTDEVEILGQAIGRMAQNIKAQTHSRERAHRRTLQAERKLAESERLATIGQFSAGLAHELNNPLTVILGSAQMARNAKGVKFKNWLDEIYQEANRCRRLVSDLLTFAKPIQLRFQRFDLTFLARETWAQIPKGELKYQLKCVSKPFMVSADKDRVKQVLLNVMRNAVEAMPQGGIVLIELKKNKGSIWVRVTDTGKGILKKDAAQLFRPFFTTKPSGTGLGLVIARSILQAHGGRIQVRANRPHGTRIILEWPSA